MIATSKLSKAYGGRTLFADVSLQLNPGSRYGLVGANGSGKTTFLKILAGDETASDGTVSIASRARVGVLRQDLSLDDGEIILDLAMMGDRDMFLALKERDKMLDEGVSDPVRLAELEDRIAHGDGRTLQGRASAVLEGLGIERAVHLQPLSTLSGGFKLRVLLAQVLIGGPDVLLLDEPTNHLDILTIRWLEKFMSAYRGTALIISHDQRFLDNVATHILDVDYETILLYPGNYSKFVIEKQLTRERKEAEIARTEKIIAEKRAFIDRFGAKATKARQAQSRLKQIEKIEVEELADTSRRSPLFRFTPARPSGKDVLEVNDVKKSYGEKHVLNGVSLTIRRGEKVGIIGANGLGKSTLLKIIVGKLPADAGTAKFGHEVHLGYFAQDHHEVLNTKATTPLDYLWEGCPSEGTSYVRGQLGRVLFSGEDVQKKISSLSGGEAARLVFGRIIVEKPNLLILDEPTNHLDMEAIESLVEGLKLYDGTVLFVSHDRWFVSELATRIIEITATGLRDFPGTYKEYLERCGDDHLDREAVSLKAKASNPPARSSVSDKPKDTKTAATSSEEIELPGFTVEDADTSPKAADISWEEKKKLRNRAKNLPARRDKILADVEKAEARRKEIATLFSEEGYYDRTPKETVVRMTWEDAELGEKIEAWLKEWEEVEREISEIDALLAASPG